MSSGSKPVMTPGLPPAAVRKCVSHFADDDRHVPGQDETVNAVVGARKQEAERRRDGLERGVKEEVLDARLPRLEERGHHRGDCRLESHGQEHHRQ